MYISLIFFLLSTSLALFRFSSCAEFDVDYDKAKTNYVLLCFQPKNSEFYTVDKNVKILNFKKVISSDRVEFFICENIKL